MATLATLQTNVAAELGLVNTAQGDQPQITVALNKAVRHMLRRTHCYITTLSSTLSAGTNIVDLNALPIIAIDELYVSAGSIGSHQLTRVSLGELVAMQAVNATVQGTPYYYALAGGNRLMVYPTPAVQEMLTGLQVPYPTEMSAAGNDPSTGTYGGIPAEYHDGLELYAEARLGSLADDASSGQGVRYRTDYNDFIREMKADLKQRAGRRLPRLIPPAQARRGRMTLQPGQRGV